MPGFDGAAKRFGPVTVRDTGLAAVLGAVGDRAGLVSFSYQPPALSELFPQAVAA